MPDKLVLTLPKHSRPHHKGRVTAVHAHHLPAHVRTFESTVHNADLVDLLEPRSIDCAVFAATPRMQLRRPGLPRVWQFFSSYPPPLCHSCLPDSDPSLNKPTNKPRSPRSTYLKPPSSSDDFQHPHQPATLWTQCPSSGAQVTATSLPSLHQKKPLPPLLSHPQLPPPRP